LGLLALGKKWDEEVFDERDLEIVTLIAQQATLVWMTSAHMAELREVPALLAKAQKHERFRIAQDLHDTVQQRLGGLQFLLDTCLDQVIVNPTQASQLLERCALETERTAQIVSRIRDNLAPPESERVLDGGLAAAAAEFERRTSVAVTLEVAPTLAKRLSLEAQGELVLVVQQALDNVAEHAGAAQVRIALEDAGRRATLLVEDDGCGFSEARRVTARAAGSFGLISMQARLLGLGGELRIDSAPGGGTRVNGWLPLRV
jgi:signal transduction histidine kinase